MGRRRPAAAMVAAFLTGALALAAPGAATAAPAANNGMQYRVLVFTNPDAEQAQTTAAGISAIKAIGKEQRFVTQFTSDPTEFRPDRLKQFGAVVFLNTAGDVL